MWPRSPFPFPKLEAERGRKGAHKGNRLTVQSQKSQKCSEWVVYVGVWAFNSKKKSLVSVKWLQASSRSRIRCV